VRESKRADAWLGALVPAPSMTRPLVQAFLAIDPDFLPPARWVSDDVLWDYAAYVADAERRGERRSRYAKPKSYR